MEVFSLLLLLLLLLVLLATITYHQVQLFKINDYMRIIMWTLKLLNIEHRTSKVLQAGV